MGFFEAYVFFGITSITALVTFCLNQLFESKHEKIGLVILWILLILSVALGFNKLHLLWLAPLSFIIPYYAIRINKDIAFKYFGTILGIILFSVILLGITVL
ncbi:MAG: hypothetical protein WCE54_18950 [Ignavibacteriaceae bacterium]